MMAAIHAARAGASFTIVEHTDRGGKKILSTGNGKMCIRDSPITNDAEELVRTDYVHAEADIYAKTEYHYTNRCLLYTSNWPTIPWEM